MKKIMYLMAALALLTAVVQAEEIAELVGDPVAGAKVFNKCKACHTVNKGDKNRVGPNLFGVAGAPGGQVAGFKYSPAHLMKVQEEGFVWDDAALEAYLAAPRTYIPGNRMVFVGLKKPQDRADVIAYLKTLHDEKAATEE